jgi:hypothetical protein
MINDPRRTQASVSLVELPSGSSARVRRRAYPVSSILFPDAAHHRRRFAWKTPLGTSDGSHRTQAVARTHASLRIAKKAVGVQQWVGRHSKPHAPQAGKL